ncbi:MAG: ATP12 family protein [Pseudomonadota bacterium]
MSGWARIAKRFYARAEARPIDGAPPGVEGAHGVFLDDRPLRCPGGSLFAAPPSVAQAAAAEWDAVVEQIDPRAMPITRAVNTALERVAPQREAVIAEISGYAETDLLCHRAAAPHALATREAQAWDPVLSWLEQRYGARLIAGVGVSLPPQPADAAARLRAAVASECDLGLTALSDLTALSGSLALGLAVVERELTAEAAWSASRIDEDWQAEQWGLDQEAADAAEERRRAFTAAARLSALLRSA